MRTGSVWVMDRMRVAVFSVTVAAVIGTSASPALAASEPSAGTAPRVLTSRATHRVIGNGKHAPTRSPAPPLAPARGKVTKAAAPSSNPHDKAELGGVAHLGPPHPGDGRLIIPPPSAAPPPKVRNFTPTSFYSSTQLDNFSAQCGFGVDETTIAQSTDNPNLVVGGANTYYDNAGNCQDSHAGVYYSSDGGQHFKFEVMPGLLFPSSGDPVVTYDPVRHVFVFAFVEFNRADGTQGRIGVEVSSDGVNWSRNTTLDSNNASYGTDKPSITVDQNPGSPHYGRVLVAWTQFHGNNAVYQVAYTDDGGVSWTGGDASVNQTSHECGNGTSPAFNANGEAMVVWADCTGGVNSMYSELSTDGGRTWSTGVDHQITTTNPIEGPEDNSAAGCFLNHGGTAFRCNSFPSLAGDPNSADAGGTAFVVNWADVRSTTQNSQTANVSQIMSLSTVDDGTTWDHLSFMNFVNFGDKFFPAASFAPNGRLTVSYSSREQSASTTNPNGKSFNEHQTEAGSLSALRAASYVTYTADGTLGDPGTLAFIGDYAGNTSLDSNFDTFPIWTDLRNGFPSARTQDLCYSDCMTFLSPDVPLSLARTAGTVFTDFYRLSMDPATGSGQDFWNVVAERPGGSSIDDDTLLAPNRYFNSSLASSAFGTGTIDYVVINGNVGHAANTVYFPQVHNFAAGGGSYSIEWDAGHITLGTALADSMGSANVARVYDTFLGTGTTYFFGLRPAAGNTSNYTLLLHSASSSSYQGRPSAVATSAAAAPGSPAFAQYGTGADPSQFDGLVALNNNGGSGSYTLYRDTAAPSGTVTIDGGAQSTNTTTLNLTLAATNPTSGDPVSDMQISVDGGAFGPFQPFSTSTSVSIPATVGTHTVTVKYRNGAGAVGTPATSSVYYEPSPPTLSTVRPNGGDTGGGKTVLITGTHLAPGATVSFGGSASSTVTFVDGNDLKALVPSHAAGTVDVRVTTPAGTTPISSGDLYAFGAPTVSSFTPTSGITGSEITIDGTGYVPGATVSFGGSPAPAVSFVNSGRLKAVIPNGDSPSKVSVTTPGGTGTSTANFTPSLSITGFSPASGPAGTVVTINGVGFNGGSAVKFNGTGAAGFTFVSSTTIQAKAPAGGATGPITVTNSSTPTGTVQSASYYAFAAPTVTSFSPGSGITGSQVTVNGTNFVPGSKVSFGSLASPSVSFVNTGKLTATVPNGAAPGKVSVTTPAGTGSSATNFIPSLSITDFSPGGGPPGTVVTINGAGFNSGSTVKFNGTTATSVTLISSAQLSATAPAGGTTGPITVTNGSSPAGTVQSVAYYAFAAPTVTSFSPSSGITGSQVTVNGTNFVPGATVKFNGLASPVVTFVSTTRLTATVPNGASTGQVSVTTAAGTGASATSYTVTLSITGFSPASGPAGTVVTINGVGFTSSSTVQFHGTAATSVTFVSPSQLKATVPSAASTGQITVTNTASPAGAVKSQATFTKT